MNSLPSYKVYKQSTSHTTDSSHYENQSQNIYPLVETRELRWGWYVKTMPHFLWTTNLILWSKIIFTCLYESTLHLCRKITYLIYRKFSFQDKPILRTWQIFIKWETLWQTVRKRQKHITDILQVYCIRFLKFLQQYCGTRKFQSSFDWKKSFGLPAC